MANLPIFEYNIPKKNYSNLPSFEYDIPEKQPWYVDAFNTILRDAPKPITSGASGLMRSTQELRQRAGEGILGDNYGKIDRFLGKYTAYPSDERLKKASGFLEGVENQARETYPVDQDFEQSLPGQIVSGASQMPAQLVTGGARIPLMAGQMYQEGSQDAFRETGDNDTAFEAGLANMPMAALDAVIPGKLASRFSKAFTGGKASVRSIKRVLADMALDAPVEGVTESAQTMWLNNLANNFIGYDENREIGEGAMNAFIVGSTVGAGTSLGLGVAENRMAKQFPTVSDPKSIEFEGQNYVEPSQMQFVQSRGDYEAQQQPTQPTPSNVVELDSNATQDEVNLVANMREEYASGDFETRGDFLKHLTDKGYNDSTVKDVAFIYADNIIPSNVQEGINSDTEAGLNQLTQQSDIIVPRETFDANTLQPEPFSYKLMEEEIDRLDGKKPTTSNIENVLAADIDLRQELDEFFLDKNVKYKDTLIDPFISKWVEGDVDQRKLFNSQKVISDRISSYERAIGVSATKANSLVNKIKSLEKNLSKSKTRNEIDSIEAQKRSLKKGVSIGRREATRSLIDLKKAVSEYAGKTLPKGTYKHGAVRDSLAMIARAKTPNDFKKAVEKIDALSEKTSSDQATNAFSKLLKTRSKTTKDAIKKGRTIGADTYQDLNYISNIAYQSKEDVQGAIDELLVKQSDNNGLDDSDTNKLRLLNKFGSFRSKNSNEKMQSYQDLKLLVETGRDKWQEEQSKVFIENDKHRQEIIDANLEDGERLPRPGDRDYNKSSPMDLVKNFDNKQQSFEYLIDSLFDKTKLDRFGSNVSQEFNAKINDSLNSESKGKTEFIAIINDAAQANYGLSGRKLNKRLHDDRMQNNTGIYKRSTNPDTGEESIVGKDPIKASNNELLKKWMEWQDPTLRETLRSQGFNESVIKDIENYLPKGSINQGKWLLDVFYPQYYKRVNEVYRKIYGIDLDFNDKYSPIKRVYAKGDKQDDMLDKNSSPFASFANNSLMRRQASSDRDLEMTDAIGTALTHVSDMEHFIGWAETIRDLRQVFGNENVKKVIQAKKGKSLDSSINEFIDILARGGGDNRRNVRTVDWVRKNLITAHLGLNPVVFIKQMTSIPAYASEIPVGSFAKYSKQFWSNPLKAAETLSGSELMKRRGESFDRDVKEFMQDTQSKGVGISKLRDKLLILTKLGDKGAIVVGGYPVYKYHYDRMISSGENAETAHKKGIREFELSTRRTQQSGEISDLSIMQQGGSFMKAMTMYMTAPNSYFRMELNALKNLASGRNKKEAAKRLAIAHFLLPALFQWAAMGFQDFTGAFEDDEDVVDKRLNRMKKAVTLGSFNGVLIAGGMAESVLNRLFSGDKWLYSVSPVSSEVTNAIKAVGDTPEDVKDLLDDTSIENVIDVIDTLMEAQVPVAGLPYKTTKRVGSGVYDALTGENEASPMNALGYSDTALGKN